MDFQEAIQKIEERGDFNRYVELKPVFEEQLHRLQAADYTERALCYYYLLVSYLKAQLVHETEESVLYFEEMDELFLKQEDVYQAHSKKFTQEEIQDFYKLMERCYNSLEFLYLRHNFKLRRELAYQRKMFFRKNAFFQKREILSALEYKFLEITCLYGTSLIRWAFATFVFVFIVSFGYMAIDKVQPDDLHRMIHGEAHWFDYFYFSVMILTTVGLGDIHPVTLAGKMLTSVEALFGFLMIGIFIGMLQKRLN